MVRGDIRALPFPDASFDIVLAPYGILQSLLRDKDFNATIDAVARVLRPGGRFGIDLVPDVPNWKEYNRKVALDRPSRAHGPAGLARRVGAPGSREAADHLRPRVPRGLGPQPAGAPVHGHVPDAAGEDGGQAPRSAPGFRVAALLGDYDGRPWDDRAQTWIMLAERN